MIHDRFLDPGWHEDSIDRLGERRADEVWLAQEWKSERSRVLRVAAQGVLEVGDPATVLDRPRPAESVPQVLLGRTPQGLTVFADLDSSVFVQEPHVTVRTLLMDRSPIERELVAQATALAQWHALHPHCARCGAPTDLALAGYVRRCASCAIDHHPRTDPAVIVLVTDERDRALLARATRWPSDRFSTLAGFVEPGESAENALRREVREETGIDLAEVAYRGSQPWPFPASLMLGYRASARTTAIVVDGTEIAEARWFSRADLTAALASGALRLPPATSISRQLVEEWFTAPSAP